MMNTSNIKDKVSTILGILGAIAGSLLVAGQNGVALPPIVTAICGVVASVSVGVIGWLTGKTPSADKKSVGQVVNQNSTNP